jgi:uncharacterized membrane protein YhaH (DUF805 family)
MADIFKIYFSPEGRIARLPYFLYNLGLGVLSAIISLGLNALEKNSATAVEANQTDLILLIAAILAIVIFIAMAVAGFILVIKRLHDLDRSGWLSLIGLIPLVNIIFGLYLLFAKGTPGPNRFGPPPV